MNQFEALHALIALEERGSLTASAEYLNIPKSTLSRRISKLEEQLNTRLTLEDRGRLSLSKAGLCYVDYARKILDVARESKIALQRFSQEVSGEIKLQLCSDLSSGWIVTVLNDFLRAYPHARLKISRMSTLTVPTSTNDVILTCDNTQPIAGFKCIKLGAWERKLYVAKRAPLSFELPTRLEQLPSIPWVVKVGEASVVSLQHKQSHEQFSVEHNARLSVDSLTMLAEAVAQGYGIGVLPCWVAQCKKHGRQHDFQPCLPHLHAPPLAFSAYVHQQDTSYTIRAFIAFLQHNFPERWMMKKNTTKSSNVLGVSLVKRGEQKA